MTQITLLKKRKMHHLPSLIGSLAIGMNELKTTEMSIIWRNLLSDTV